MTIKKNIEARKCKCGNTFYVPPYSAQRHCSRKCGSGRKRSIDKVVTAEQMIALLNNGYTYNAVAKFYGICRNSVFKAVKTVGYKKER